MHKDIPHCFYFIVYNKLKEKFPNKVADIKEAKNLLRAWNIPKELKPVILKEMELLGLIKLISKYKMQLIGKGNILNNKSRVFAMVGLWGQAD